MIDKSVTKSIIINTIDTSGILLKTQYKTGKSDQEKKTYDTDKKIPDTSGLNKKQTIIQLSLILKIKYLVLLAWLRLHLFRPFKIRYPKLVILFKKTVMLQKYLTLRLNILPHLIIMNLQMKYLMQR